MEPVSWLAMDNLLFVMFILWYLTYGIVIVNSFDQQDSIYNNLRENKSDF